MIKDSGDRLCIHSGRLPLLRMASFLNSQPDVNEEVAVNKLHNDPYLCKPDQTYVNVNALIEFSIAKPLRLVLQCSRCFLLSEQMSCLRP